MSRFKKLGNNSPVTAQQFNALQAQVERLLNLTVLPPMTLTNTGAGINISISGSGFWATLLTDGCGPYTWKEAQPVGDGTFTLVTQGRTGSPTGAPAFEVNGNCVAGGPTVWLWPGLNGEYYFLYCCGPGGGPQSQSNSGFVCFPVMVAIRCEDGLPVATMQYLYLPAYLGAYLSETPCVIGGGLGD
jgi:hypothetical protein